MITFFSVRVVSVRVCAHPHSSLSIKSCKVQEMHSSNKEAVGRQLMLFRTCLGLWGFAETPAGTTSCLRSLLWVNASHWSCTLSFCPTARIGLVTRTVRCQKKRVRQSTHFPTQNVRFFFSLSCFFLCQKQLSSSTSEMSHVAFGLVGVWLSGAVSCLEIMQSSCSSSTLAASPHTRVHPEV